MQVGHASSKCAKYLGTEVSSAYNVSRDPVRMHLGGSTLPLNARSVMLSQCMSVLEVLGASDGGRHCS